MYVSTFGLIIVGSQVTVGTPVTIAILVGTPVTVEILADIPVTVEILAGTPVKYNEERSSEVDPTFSVCSVSSVISIASEGAAVTWIWV